MKEACLCVCVCVCGYVGEEEKVTGEKEEKDAMKKVVPSVLLWLISQPPQQAQMSHFQTTSTSPARFAFQNVALLFCISAQNPMTRVFRSRCSIGCGSEVFGDEDVVSKLPTAGSDVLCRIPLPAWIQLPASTIDNKMGSIALGTMLNRFRVSHGYGTVSRW